ncbi:hypothetical protein B0T18DRAFT_422178 [Schizothecium vesticola]|uniref:Uncharacterized protein n=1 Tax=Schizothecium vesticola TaxID=314040 RepID=A0AA40BQK6_9PEZI|nr:hypothetical protein B0T18DRAFT_422178 [Schizothecium vesticola]
MQDMERIGRAGEPVRDGPVVVRTYGQGYRDAGGGGAGARRRGTTPGWLFRGGVALRLGPSSTAALMPSAIGFLRPCSACSHGSASLRLACFRLLAPCWWCCRDEQLTANYLMVRHRYARAPSTVHGLCHRAKSPGVHCRHRAISLAQSGRAGIRRREGLRPLPLCPDRATKRPSWNHWQRPGGFSEQRHREEWGDATLSRQSEGIETKSPDED